MPLLFADGITSILEKPSDNLIMLLMMGGLVLVAVIALIGGIWHSFRKTEIEGCLKRDMIERGMSADEIERVLAAKMGPPKTPAVVMRFGTKGTVPTEKQTLPYSEPKPK